MMDLSLDLSLFKIVELTRILAFSLSHFLSKSRWSIAAALMMAMFSYPQTDPIKFHFRF